MTETPDPIPAGYLRGMIERAGISQRQAARMLHVDERTVRKWCCEERSCPWAAAELLRRLNLESDESRTETQYMHHNSL